MNNDITLEYLKSILSYDCNSGIFSWLIRPSVRVMPGDKAGKKVKNIKSGNTYIDIGINKRRYAAHRLAWLYINGEWPRDQIDHIDGDGLNNRIDNLRQATYEINSRNKRLGSANKSGLMGVHWVTRDLVWSVRISNNNKSINLGYFKNLLDAACARKDAEIKFGYHENHGRIK